MDSAGDSPPNRKVSGFLAQDDTIGRQPCPGPNQIPSVGFPASALGASLRTPSGNSGNESGCGGLSGPIGTVEV